MRYESYYLKLLVLVIFWNLEILIVEWGFWIFKGEDVDGV